MPAVRDWMKLRGTVNKPPNEISARPVKGHFLLEFINNHMTQIFIFYLQMMKLFYRLLKVYSIRKVTEVVNVSGA